MEFITRDEAAALGKEIKALRKELQTSSRGTLNREEAATYLGISTRNLHELRARGKIKAVQLSPGRHAFRRVELDRYLEENEVGAEDSSEAVAKRLYKETT